MGEEVSGVCTQGQIPLLTTCPEGWLATRLKMSHCSIIIQVPGDTVPGTEPKSLQDVLARRATFLVPSGSCLELSVGNSSDSSQKQR